MMSRGNNHSMSPHLSEGKERLERHPPTARAPDRDHEKQVAPVGLLPIVYLHVHVEPLRVNPGELAYYVVRFTARHGTPSSVDRSQCAGCTHASVATRQPVRETTPRRPIRGCASRAAQLSAGTRDCRSVSR